MNDKSMTDIMARINAMQFHESFDVIVAIANGGIIPAALLSQRLQLRVELLRISLRDSQQRPLYNEPLLLEQPNFEIADKTILLVEDRIKTGATIQFAQKLLTAAKLVKTFAVNGPADYAVYNETCFKFPWIMPIAAR
jgi:uncharacterized protein